MNVTTFAGLSLTQQLQYLMEYNNNSPAYSPLVYPLLQDMTQALESGQRFRSRSDASYRQRYFDLFLAHPELHSKHECTLMLIMAHALDSRPFDDDNSDDDDDESEEDDIDDDNSKAENNCE